MPSKVSQRVQALLKAYGHYESRCSTPSTPSPPETPPRFGTGDLLPRELPPLRAFRRQSQVVKPLKPVRRKLQGEPPNWRRSHSQRGVPKRPASSPGSTTGTTRPQATFTRQTSSPKASKDIWEASKVQQLAGEIQSSLELPEQDEEVKPLQKWELHRLAREVNMQVDELVEVKDIFDSFDEDDTGTLDIGEFQNVAMRILCSQLGDTDQAAERARHLCERNFSLIDSDGSGSVDFEEFLRWYSSRSFHQSLLLTDRERQIRDLAKKVGLDANTVDKVKEYYDGADVDRSGAISYEEFAEILPRMLKLPAGQKLSERRIQHFWNEADTNHDNSLAFSEFLFWWCKNFTRDTAIQDFLRVQNPEIMGNFYKSVRRLKVEFDPPPEWSRVSEPEDKPPRRNSTFVPL